MPRRLIWVALLLASAALAQPPTNPGIRWDAFDPATLPLQDTDRLLIAQGAVGTMPNPYLANLSAMVAAVLAHAPGSDTMVIFNDGGVFGADAGLTYDKTSDDLTMTGNLLMANSNGPAIFNEAASPTNPTLIPMRSSPSSGVGQSAYGTGPALIVGGRSMVDIDATDVYLTNEDGNRDTVHLLDGAVLRMHDIDGTGSVLFQVPGTMTGNRTCTLRDATDMIPLTCIEGGGAATDIWVDEGGDTMTGDLIGGGGDNFRLRYGTANCITPTFNPNFAALTDGIGWCTSAGTSSMAFLEDGVAKMKFNAAGPVIPDGQYLQWNEAGGSDAVRFAAPASLASSRTCTFRDAADMIPLSCIEGGGGATDIWIDEAGDTFTGNITSGIIGSWLHNSGATETAPSLGPVSSEQDTGIGWDSNNCGGSSSLTLVTRGVLAMDVCDLNVQFAGNVRVDTGKLILPATTFANADDGVIYKGGNRFLHDFNYGNNGTVTTIGGNLFLGLRSGNFTMGATAIDPNYSSLNTMVGYDAGGLLTTGWANTAIGGGALTTVTTGDRNFAGGQNALSVLTTGGLNTAIGASSLTHITDATQNTAVGYNTLGNLTSGNGSVALGYQAGTYTLDGTTPVTSTIASIYLGHSTEASAASGNLNEIVIGWTAEGHGTNTATLGNDSITDTYLKGDQRITESVYLPATTFADQEGVLFKGGMRFLHDFNYGNNGTVTTNGNNTFLGINAGNLTAGSTAIQIYQASNNTMVGHGAGSTLTSGYSNDGFGAFALMGITSGAYNTALGGGALTAMVTGSGNVGVGGAALLGIDNDIANTGVGYISLGALTNGNGNTGLGYFSGYFLADGSTANTTATGSVHLGAYTESGAASSSNEIVIGYQAEGHGSNTVTLGNDSVTDTYLKGIEHGIEDTKCINIDPAHSTTNWLFFRAERALTLTGIDCLVDAATSVVLTLRECDSNGGSCSDSEAAITCGTTNTTEASSIDNPSVDAGDWMRVTRGTLTGSATQATLCVTFVVQ